MVHQMLSLDELGEVNLVRPMRPPDAEVFEVTPAFMLLHHGLGEHFAYRLMVVAGSDRESEHVPAMLRTP